MQEALCPGKDAGFARRVGLPEGCVSSESILESKDEGRRVELTLDTSMRW
jgi:hypothetical protein